MSFGLPAGYVDLDRGHTRIVAARLDLSEMVALLEGPERDRPAEDPCDSSDGASSGGANVKGGRGGARRLVLPGGRPVYLRKYLRGGFARHFVRDLYLLRPARPIRELIATEAARAAGCHVPVVHGVCVEEAGLFYRGWIVTSALDQASPLIDSFLAGDEKHRADLLRSVGAAVRRLHDAGVFHPDLTGHNVLTEPDGRIALIDFDRTVLGDASDFARAQAGCDRFWRSMTKLVRASGDELDDHERRWFERGYRP